MEYDPEEHYEIAYFTVYTFYASAAINLTIILGVTTMELFGSLKRLYAYCFKKKSKNDEKSEQNKNSKSAIMIDVKVKVNKPTSQGTIVEVVHLQKSLSARKKTETQLILEEESVVEAVHL